MADAFSRSSDAATRMLEMTAAQRSEVEADAERLRKMDESYTRLAVALRALAASRLTQSSALAALSHEATPGPQRWPWKP